MKEKNNLTDSIYRFKGEWDMDSQCGLKIHRAKNGMTIVIATDLYNENPGTSVTRWNAPLATAIAAEYQIPHNKLYFIEHTPDRGSKLTFYTETFYHVSFLSDGEKLVDPNWEKLTREEVETMLSS
ncbi:MAG: hypothetical protein M0R21_01325 [Lentimicrobiaceae bacterium]|jgi:hypothetical protein|nr:hypothetical protein [Lentimicrobiaceae bacterium]